MTFCLTADFEQVDSTENDYQIKKEAYLVKVNGFPSGPHQLVIFIRTSMEGCSRHRDHGRRMRHHQDKKKH